MRGVFLAAWLLLSLVGASHGLYCYLCGDRHFQGGREDLHPQMKTCKQNISDIKVTACESYQRCMAVSMANSKDSYFKRGCYQPSEEFPEKPGCRVYSAEEKWAREDKQMKGTYYSCAQDLCNDDKVFETNDGKTNGCPVAKAAGQVGADKDKKSGNFSDDSSAGEATCNLCYFKSILIVILNVVLR